MLASASRAFARRTHGSSLTLAAARGHQQHGQQLWAALACSLAAVAGISASEVQTRAESRQQQYRHHQEEEPILERPPLGKRFDLEQRSSLGTGHYGKVFNGLDRQTGAPVAIKCVSRQMVGLDDMIMEASVMKKMDFHPNIINYKGMVTDAQNYYLIMERAEGGELYERLTKEGLTSLSESEVRRVARDVCSAIAHMHACGVVHGDLKPENLLLNDMTDFSSVKLADFGSAFFIDKPCLKSSTTAYSAPEVIRGEESVDQKIDVWGLGVILYILCTGFHPFDINTNLSEDEVADAVMREEPSWENFEAWKGSPSIIPLIKSMLSKDPSKRPTAEEVLHHPWFAAASP